MNLLSKYIRRPISPNDFSAPKWLDFRTGYENKSHWRYILYVISLFLAGCLLSVTIIFELKKNLAEAEQRAKQYADLARAEETSTQTNPIGIKYTF